MLANYHTHTPRCHHAYGSEKEYIEEAIKCGFKILGFSEHVPFPESYGFNPTMRMAMEDLPDYTSTLVKLREEYKNDIEILIGYEVEYSEKYFEATMKTLREYPFDFVIQGQHFIDGDMIDIYAGSPTKDDNYLKAYVDATIKGMKTGEFKYLAHPDLINYKGDKDLYLSEMNKIIDASLEYSLPLEINMYGFIDQRNYPNKDFWKMVGQSKADVVIGCDAHWPHMIRRPEDVPGLMEFIKESGIKEIKN
ncbi:MAG: histidinol-phosphatase [Eubacterium sp.]|nr:histidinol-phosphatase [Eubacterium sp.]